MRLSTPLLLLLSLAGCSTTYSSVEQASTACNSWKEKGEIINYNHDLTWTEKFWKFNKTNPEPSIETLEWEDWFEKRKLYFASSPKKKISVASRECKQDPDAAQVLGFENRAVKDGTWKNIDGQRGVFELIKSFGY